MLAIKEIVRIFFIQVGTLKFADISLQVGTFNNAYNPSTNKDKTKVPTADLKIGRHRKKNVNCRP